MKRRLVLAALCLALVCALVPLQSARADDAEGALLRAALEGGTDYTLTTNATLDNPIEISGNATLMLEGFSITCSAGSAPHNPALRVVGGTLEIVGPGTITGFGTEDFGVYVLGGNVSLKGCTVGAYGKGGLHVEQGSAEIYNATLMGRGSANGAALEIGSSGSVTIYSGKIMNNGNTNSAISGTPTIATGSSIAQGPLTAPLVYVARPLDVPASLFFRAGVANCDSYSYDDGRKCEGFTVQLIKDTVVLREVNVSTDNPTYDFSTDIQAAGDGAYFCKAWARGDGITSVDSDPYEIGPLLVIISGANGHWVQGSSSGLRVVSNGKYDEFLLIVVDDDDVDRDPDKYKVENGSTIVTLLPAYLSTLPVGQHSLAFAYSGTTWRADTSFWVDAPSPVIPVVPTAAASVPKTGDNAPLALLCGLILLSGAGLVASRALRKRKETR